ncbi:MAG: cell division protein FtsQ/DivIB, partial [Anaerolineae bacterium]
RGTRSERTRAEEVRSRRREQSQKRVTKSSAMASRPLPPITSRGGTTYAGRERATIPTARRKYQAALSMPGIEVRMPAIQITSAGIRRRLFSVFLCLLLGTALYMALTLPEFHVVAAQITGNQRISAEELNTTLGATGQSIFMLTGKDLETRLRLNYPELESVHVTIGLPNVVSVSVVERQPVLLWQQANGYAWIDAHGVAFRPRGEPGNLVTVAAFTAPPPPANAVTDPLSPMPYISADLVKAVQTIAPDVPQGTTIEYDPKFGLGWADSRGWKVFFGTQVDDMPLKLQVYKSLVDSLAQRGIQPTFISVQYANAPYYRISQ